MKSVDVICDVAFLMARSPDRMQLFRKKSGRREYGRENKNDNARRGDGRR